jgi:transposase
VHVRPDGATFRCDTDAEGLQDLVRRLKPLTPALAVLEASGGYESVVAVTLAEAGVPVAIVNRARSASPPPLTHSPEPNRFGLDN